MANLHEVLKNKIGFGTAPLGNMFRDIPQDEALATVEAAWNEGIRYFDTAPFYGAGLAESRLGEVLSQHNRDEYVLSTKVGRLILDEEEEKSPGLFTHGRSNKIATDYTTDATLRSIEESLKRLKTDRLDFVFIHDTSRDFLGDEWVAKFNEARTGAFRVLARLQDEGVINGWGLGVNTTEPIELAMDMDEAAPTMSLSATQYTLLQHERALQRMMPKAQELGVGIIVGGPFNSGALLGGDKFDYAEIPPEVKARIAELGSVAGRHDVSLKAAALQFSAAHPAVAAVIPGSSRPGRVAEDVAAMKAEIPGAFWDELLEKKLISAQAPLPRS
ncbi:MULTISPECIES: aldo/keto reductase [unclassified Arthrobacter]|uniref:aldo/keto reductase n=1 Tax=unclassified Arthrobacter TaxID=235627 RepID=UPI001E59F923|nr:MULTISPECIES: aldo/keto reductase [unclassified Arthrobacter]MCC9146341.1 aldo/keto reductase [Arthrobacter sp. zg-Y919]MDK1277571.1 aldo/keto reductase [Arthrobacter sp. zg.Y919]WIB04054.1 aldo/keto reductase [Arthrobacter sp. zg-Y919]